MDKLGAVGGPESLTWLKTTTEAMLPRIDLPDLLFEVHSWTGFLDTFGHVSERRPRTEGLLVSLVAPLVSQSCAIGPTPVIAPENKALTRSRLSHVDQNYVRADTIATHRPDILRVAGSLIRTRCGLTSCCGCSAARAAPPPGGRVR